MSLLPNIPTELRDLMAKVGPIWGSDTKGHVQLMIDKFTEVLKWSPKDNVTIQSMRYGDHERQAFEIFYPPQNGNKPKPCLIFVHGGAFTEGSRHRSPEIYANVLYYFARHGIIGVNVGYRLAPDATYPQATVDVSKVVTFVREHAADMNVDPHKIFLMGHSAGGAHVGTYAYDKRFRPANGTGLAGVFIISGRVRADARKDNPNAQRVAAYYGDDPQIYNDVSPVSHIDAESPPTLVACAEYENPLIDVYCLELAYKLAAAKGRAPPVVWLKGHNHTSIIAHFNTSEDDLGRACLQFIADHSLD